MIELYGVAKAKNLKILRDPLNKAYTEANILTIVRLLKSGNKNNVKLACDGKVPSQIKHSDMTSKHRNTSLTFHSLLCATNVIGTTQVSVTVMP